MRLLRLRGRKTNDYLLRNGRVWKGKTMIIRYLPGHPKNLPEAPKFVALYLGTFASGKLHASAVERNRMRRRCREGIRLAVQTQEVPSAWQALMTPKPASAGCAFADIQADARTFLALLQA